MVGLTIKQKKEIKKYLINKNIISIDELASQLLDKVLDDFNLDYDSLSENDIDFIETLIYEHLG